MKNYNKFIITLVILSLVLSPLKVANIFALEDIFSSNLLEKKLYTDSDFGYSFYYPADFILRESLVAGELSLSNYDPSIAPDHRFSGNQFKISTYIYERPESLSLIDWFFSGPSDSDFPVKINSFTETIINGIQGIRTNTTGYYGIASESVYLPINQHKVLQISVLPATPYSIETFDMILNSFNKPIANSSTSHKSLSIFSPKLAYAGDLTLPFYLSPIITSYFDHSSPNYTNDGITTVFDGRVALSSNGICWSWPPGAPTFFAYLDNTGNCLYYNGHDGIDFDTGYGDSIIAAADGQITFAGCSNPPYCDQDLGRYVKVWHQNLGYSTLYGHLLDIATSTIYAGAPVTRGQLLGWSDHTGAASGDHLHFMVRNAQTGGVKADPYGWIPGPSAATTTDPCQQPSQPCVNLGYLWTTNPPSLNPPVPPAVIMPTFTSVSGPITQNTTWITAGSPYVIDGLATVNSGVTLTIQPGVVVKFKPQTGGSQGILTVNGTLNAQGTATNKIYFTSFKDDSVGGDTNGDGSTTAPATGDWESIEFSAGSSGNFSNVLIAYGTNNNVWIRGALYNNGGNLSVSNSEISNNDIGIYQDYGSLNITSNKFYDNFNGGVFQDGGTVTGTLNEFYSSLSGSSSQYRGFSLKSGGTANLFQNNFHDLVGYGIEAHSGTLILSNNSFANNYAAGSISSSANFIHSGNTASGTGLRGWVMNSGIFIDRTWTAGDLVYIIQFIPSLPDLGFTIYPGKTLTLEPNVIVKFPSNSHLASFGTLNAQGTSQNKVYFTSIKDDLIGGDTNGDGSTTIPAAGDFVGLLFVPGSSGTLNYLDYRYGGLPGSSWAIPSALPQGGIKNMGGTLNIQNSRITDHLYTGINQTAGMTTISQSSIHSNTQYGVYSTTAAPIVTAINNWWASPTGPYHPTLNPGGAGNQVSNNVSFSPWLNYDPTSPQPCIPGTAC